VASLTTHPVIREIRDAVAGNYGVMLSEKKARALLAEIERPLQALVGAHHGFHLGVGPCVCVAHENARRLLADLRSAPEWFCVCGAAMETKDATCPRCMPCAHPDGLVNGYCCHCKTQVAPYLPTESAVEHGGDGA
jgi:hypothetical protein